MSERFNIAYGGNVITDEDGRDLDLTVKWCVEELVDLLNEQQATISALKEENEQLRQQLQDWDDMVELATKTSLRNVELDEQIGQLRKELNDCEKFRYTVFKRIGELNDE